MCVSRRWMSWPICCKRNWISAALASCHKHLSSQIRKPTTWNMSRAMTTLSVVCGEISAKIQGLCPLTVRLISMFMAVFFMHNCNFSERGTGVRRHTPTRDLATSPTKLMKKALRKTQTLQCARAGCSKVRTPPPRCHKPTHRTDCNTLRRS